MVESGNTVYDSRNNCNAVIKTNTNELVAGCKNTVIPNTVTTIGEAAFNGCSGLTTINIPNSVTTIEDRAFDGCSSLITVVIPNSVKFIRSSVFAQCKGLTSITIPNSVTDIGSNFIMNSNSLKEVKSMITEPFEIYESTFWSTPYTFTSATLYVPAGTKAKYEATDGWKEFKTIIEMEPQQELEPVDDSEEIDFGGSDSAIDENTDMDGNVIGNIYYNIAPGDGGYNPVEGCIEVKKPTSDEDVEELEGQDIFGEDASKQFTGIVFKVPAGNGTITVNGETIGGMTLKVKIGSQEPIELMLVGKMKMKIPYSVTKPTYVYIYAGEMDADASRRQGFAASVQPCLKLYGLELNVNKTKADVNGDGVVDVADITTIISVMAGAAQ